MVSHRYWTRDLGSAPDAIGGTMRIRGNPYTIVGVTPAGFNGMVPMLSPEMWIPVSASLDVEPLGIKDTVPSPTGTTGSIAARPVAVHAGAAGARQDD
jgi:hypothetical protein